AGKAAARRALPGSLTKPHWTSRLSVFSPDSGTTRRPLPEMVHTALTCQRWTLVQNAYIFRNFLCKSRFEIFPLWDLVWKVFVYRRSKRRARMDDTLE
uniref:Uncharacterized protein n=1 Tax=Neogobius melanostomus TaxID=47308 RepID=A0A8C6UC70_9GOBI